MRFSFATASLAVSVALLVGCSASQGTSSLPGSSGVSQSSSVGSHAFHPYQHPNGKLSPTQLLKDEIAGKLPRPVTLKNLKWQLKQIQGQARPRYHLSPAGASVAAWASVTDYGYLIGQNKKLKKTIAAVDVESNGCYYPITVKVDHMGNVWTACEYNSSFEVGQAQEYTAGGTLSNSYAMGCPVTSCSYYLFGASFDQGENSTNVVVGAEYIEWDGEYGSGDGTGYQVYPLNSPSATPTFNDVYENGNGGVDIDEVGYLDVDNSGNVYFTFEGCDSAYPYTCGYGLAESTTSTTNGSYTVLLAPGSIGFWGGVYVAGGGSTLDVIDQDTRMVTPYALPWTGSAGAALGPTKTNALGVGDPVAGGWNSTDSTMAIGDAYGWLDSITSGNKVKTAATINCSDGCEGAAFTPSDK
jgi:hypothetical protein